MNSQLRNFIKHIPGVRTVYEKIKEDILSMAEDYQLPEIKPINARRDTTVSPQIRLNLINPSVDTKHYFGGIATAVRFFNELQDACGCEARIITTDAPIVAEHMIRLPKDYRITDCAEDSAEKLQLVSFSERFQKTIPVRENDIFIATGWWTAYNIAPVLHWQAEQYGRECSPLIYLIQDYEPGFYGWSSRYLLSESTYRTGDPVYAVINSSQLADFLDRRGYRFAQRWSFEPVLNPKLKDILRERPEVIPKKKQILLYGRPGTERNAFDIIVAALKEWAELEEHPEEWTIVSAGEAHKDVEIGRGIVLRSSGKMTLEEYAQALTDSYIGISLMVSPHPSYPPLEMAAYGAKTITNGFENKDMSAFSENISCLAACSVHSVAEELHRLCGSYDGKGHRMLSGPYIDSTAEFGTIPTQLADLIKGKKS